MGNSSGAIDWRGVNELALWLHGQQDLDALQSGFIERLADVVPYSACMFDLCREVDGRMEFFSPASQGIEKPALEEYYRTYASQDYTTWSFSPDEAIAYRDFDLIAPALRDKSPIYRGWLEPQGLYFGMGCTIVANGILHGSITLFRRRSELDFSDVELVMLRELSRHLSVHFGLLWPGGIEPGSRQVKVTSREEEVLELMATGRTNKQIAEDLFISESTVKKHINDIYRKLGVRNRVELARALYGEKSVSPRPRR